MNRAHVDSKRRHFLALIAAVPGGFAAPAWAVGDTERWAALFAAVPPLPATPAQALAAIGVRPAEQGRLRVYISDAALIALQREVDALYEPQARASQARMRETMERFNRDPTMGELARKMDRAWDRDARSRGLPPTPADLKRQREVGAEIERVLGPEATRDAPSRPRATNPIDAYRLELMQATPRSGRFMQRLLDRQRWHAQQHAQADREATPSARTEVVARHHALARQQLDEAAVLLREARAMMAPRFDRMVQLAREAEARGAPADELMSAYSFFKPYVELLLTLQRETIQDVGFWAGVRAAPAASAALYEHVLAPGVDLRSNGTSLTGMHYPDGREPVVGLPLGIR